MLGKQGYMHYGYSCEPPLETLPFVHYNIISLLILAENKIDTPKHEKSG